MAEYKENRGKVTFETIKSEEIEFGKNNFIEIALKKAVVEGGDDNVFLALSRGFHLPDGQKRFKKSIAIPNDEAVCAKIAEKIKEFSTSPKEEK